MLFDYLIHDLVCVRMDYLSVNILSVYKQVKPVAVLNTAERVLKLALALCSLFLNKRLKALKVIFLSL